jgi:hypothetical protein
MISSSLCELRVLCDLYGSFLSHYECDRSHTPWWFPAKTDAGAIREDRVVLPIPPGKHWGDEMPVLLPKESLVIGPSSLAKDKGQRTRDKGPAPKPAPREPLTTAMTGMRFAQPAAAPEKVEKPKRAPRTKVKSDPKLVAAARELRDRWLEHVNSGGEQLVSRGKYEVSRALPAPTAAKALLLAA